MKNNSAGQALLLVLLSIGVIITVALSVVARSIGEVSTTSKDEESLRAFSAAEAGVESALKLPTAQIQSSGSQSTNISTTQTSNTNFGTFPENPLSYVYPSELSSGDTATVWLASHDPSNNLTCSGANTCYTGGTIDLCWGKTDVKAQEEPALSISVLYADAGGVLKYAYATFDGVNGRAAQNNFTSTGVSNNPNNPPCVVSGTSLADKATLNLNSLVGAGVVAAKGLRAITVMSLYNGSGTLFGVNTTQNLPVQGRKIDSSGVSGASTRKVQVYSLYPEVPAMFQNAIFSPLGIIK